MNKRRKLVFAIGAGVVGAPFGSFAQQQGKVWRIGFLVAGSRPANLDTHFFMGPFLHGMRELGYAEGRNLTIEWRFAEGNSERLPNLATELANLKVDVIVVVGTPATMASKNATTTIPLVMVNVGDPVGLGFVKSLAQPAGNITGLSQMISELGGKRLELLKEMVPRLSRVTLLINSANPNDTTVLETIQVAGQKRGIKVVPMEVRTPQEIESAFSAMPGNGADAVIVSAGALFTQQRRQIAELAVKTRLPSISGAREYVEAGGLISYGDSRADSFRRASTYVDKILKGAKPGDLPVEQPTKFELFINRTTAKALGLKIPQSLLISADKVIE